MIDIGEPVIKKDHADKMSGAEPYLADLYREDILHCRLIRSPHPRARVIEKRLPQLPEGYTAVDCHDVPGKNSVPLGNGDIPVFVEDTVEYIGDPVMLLMGPDADVVERLCSEAEIVYEQLEPLLDMQQSDISFYSHEYTKGDAAAAFAGADIVYDEVFSTGYQEQGYLEPQGMMGEYRGGRLYIQGSIQCPYYVHSAVVLATGMDSANISVKQNATGGGFGGKEEWPSIVAAQVAVAALKAGGRPVRLIYGRREDMEYTSKRHPSRCRYKVAIKDGRVSAMDIDVRYDAGAYSTLSNVVLMRGIIGSCGVYNIENLHVRGCAVKTNTVPNGAFRGFGGPQTFISVEVVMEHIAKQLGREPLEFKSAHLARQGDATSTNGKYHFPVPLPAMIEAVDSMSSYREKRRLYSAPQSGRYRKGIGISLWFHGAGFTGSGERDIIKAVVKLRKSADGQVEILAANTDMGQGIKTTFCKIVANELGLPFESILIRNPDTDCVPDSGPTVASRSIMVVGELLRKASVRLKEHWQEGMEQIVEERYKHPDYLIPFDVNTFKGDAYPTYSWAVCAVELRIDTLTGSHDILGAWGSFDVGTPIDRHIVTGQMEGGLMQGLGYASMEQMFATNGRIRNNSYSDYIIPAALDIPELKVHLYVEEYPEGPYGAKGAGELPTVGAPAAYIEAVEQALGGALLNHIPFTAEDTIDALQGGK